MNRRILIAPDKFKGSLSAPEAAAAIAEGTRRLDRSAELDLCPIADGGEGFMEAVTKALSGRWVECPAVDALGRRIVGRYVLAETAEGLVAVLEMAETAGMWRLKADERNPLLATTRGVGMQMAHAVREHDVVRLVLGLGGSATNDGGCGMAAELGVDFLDGDGGKVDPKPSNFRRIQAMKTENRIDLPEITAACDVDNPLLGGLGATAVFSAQKGAGETSKPILEDALAHLVGVSGGEMASSVPGAGAAGGLGFGLLHFARAKLVSGFDLLAGLLDLEARVRRADYVVTGEGSIDRQSLSGKGPVALARLARSHGVHVVGFCGLVDQEVRESGEFDELHALSESGMPLKHLMERAAPMLAEAVAESAFLR